MNDKVIEILILDDETIVGERLKPALEKEGYKVDVFANPNAALKQIEAKEFDIVVTDIRMDEVDGIQILEKVVEKSRRTKVIMITGYATLEVARESVSKGAFDFIAKPFKLGEIRATIKKAVDALKAEEETSLAESV